MIDDMHSHWAGMMWACMQPIEPSFTLFPHLQGAKKGPVDDVLGMRQR